MLDYHKQLEIESRNRILAQHSGGLYKNIITGKKEYCLPKILGGWEPLEMQQIGQEIKLKDSEKQEIEGGKQIFSVKDSENVKISFSEIVAIAGTFYGGEEAISLPGGSDEDKKKRFKESFKVLFDNPKAKYELPKLLELIDHQVDQDQDYNDVTDKRYSDLLFNSSDNYDENARDTYRIGHNLALEVASQAKNNEELLEAYKYEAFACHYLVMLFSAGHVRNPRGRVENFIIETGFSRIPKHPLAKFLANNVCYMQHEEDSRMGVQFTNDNGDSWYGYGANYYQDEINEVSRKKINQGVQSSVNEIYEAYLQQNNIESKMSFLVPQVDWKQSNVPLLQYRGGILWIRTNTMDEHSENYVQCMDMYQISQAILDVTNTGFYDIKILDFFAELYSPLDRATNKCCGIKQSKPSKTRTTNRANWVTPKKQHNYFDLENKLMEVMDDPEKIIPTKLRKKLHEKKEQDKKPGEKKGEKNLQRVKPE